MLCARMSVSEKGKSLHPPEEDVVVRSTRISQGELWSVQGHCSSCLLTFVKKQSCYIIPHTLYARFYNQVGKASVRNIEDTNISTLRKTKNHHISGLSVLVIKSYPSNIQRMEIFIAHEPDPERMVIDQIGISWDFMKGSSRSL